MGFSILVKYFVQGAIEDSFIEKSLQLLEQDPAQVEQNPTLMCLLVYYLLIKEDYNQLLKLVNTSQNPE